MGNAGVFIYATNYLVQSYNIYAASALAGNAVARSIMGAVLPLAGPALYASLGANWAGTLLGLLEAICIPIPFIFYRYGGRIREKSSLIRAMEVERRREERKEKRKIDRAAVAAAEAERMKGEEENSAVKGAEVKVSRPHERRVSSSAASLEIRQDGGERDLEKGGL
jgi:hypothetical protein